MRKGLERGPFDASGDSGCWRFLAKAIGGIIVDRSREVINQDFAIRRAVLAAQVGERLGGLASKDFFDLDQRAAGPGAIGNLVSDSLYRLRGGIGDQGGGKIGVKMLAQSIQFLGDRGGWRSPVGAS